MLRDGNEFCFGLFLNFIQMKFLCNHMSTGLQLSGVHIPGQRAVPNTRLGTELSLCHILGIICTTPGLRFFHEGQDWWKS